MLYTINVYDLLTYNISYVFHKSSVVLISNLSFLTSLFISDSETASADWAARADSGALSPHGGAVCPRCPHGRRRLHRAAFRESPGLTEPPRQANPEAGRTSPGCQVSAGPGGFGGRDDVCSENCILSLLWTASCGNKKKAGGHGGRISWSFTPEIG